MIARLGGVLCNAPAVVSPTVFTCVAPALSAGPPRVALVVINDDETTATLADAYMPQGLRHHAHPPARPPARGRLWSFAGLVRLPRRRTHCGLPRALPLARLLPSPLPPQGAPPMLATVAPPHAHVRRGPVSLVLGGSSLRPAAVSVGGAACVDVTGTADGTRAACTLGAAEAATLRGGHHAVALVNTDGTNTSLAGAFRAIGPGQGGSREIARVAHASGCLGGGPARACLAPPRLPGAWQLTGRDWAVWLPSLGVPWRGPDCAAGGLCGRCALARHPLIGCLAVFCGRPGELSAAASRLEPAAGGPLYALGSVDLAADARDGDGEPYPLCPLLWAAESATTGLTVALDGLSLLSRAAASGDPCHVRRRLLTVRVPRGAPTPPHPPRTPGQALRRRMCAHRSCAKRARCWCASRPTRAFPRGPSTCAWQVRGLRDLPRPCRPAEVSRVRALLPLAFPSRGRERRFSLPLRACCALRGRVRRRRALPRRGRCEGDVRGRPTGPHLRLRAGALRRPNVRALSVDLPRPPPARRSAR